MLKRHGRPGHSHGGILLIFCSKCGKFSLLRRNVKNELNGS